MTEPKNTEVTNAVLECHILLAWIIPQIDRMPRQRRFTLGERLETLLLQVLENLIEAAYSRAAAKQLQRANLKLDVARHIWRLAEQLEAIPRKQYASGSEKMVGLGRQIGGWRRQQEGKADA